MKSACNTRRRGPGARIPLRVTAIGMATLMALPAAADENIQSRFKRLDANSDGEIAWSEAYPVRAGEFLEMDETLDGLVSEAEFGDRALPFDQFDADGDGSMVLSEYVGQHRRMFERFDADSSGTIDQAEFAEAQAAVRRN